MCVFEYYTDVEHFLELFIHFDYRVRLENFKIHVALVDIVVVWKQTLKRTKTRMYTFHIPITVYA